MSRALRKVLIFTAIVVVVSVGYFVYVYTTHPPIQERETFLSEIGEGFGEVGLWMLLFIYARTALKLVAGKGAMARRLIPDYSPPATAPGLHRLLGLLDRTHVYVGIATVAVILLHIALMGIPMDVLFFPLVIGLVLWQGLFGMFITWRYSPKQIRKFSYLVHAQLFTGIMIGVFAYAGHLLID